MRKLLIAVLLIVVGCAPASTPEPPRRPTIPPTIAVIIDTITPTTAPTETSTFTPIPPTLTATPTDRPRRSLQIPGQLSGLGSEIIDIPNQLPIHVEITATVGIRINVIHLNGYTKPLGDQITIYPDNPPVSLEIITTGDWTIVFLPDATPVVASRKPTLKPIVSKPSPIPTVFLPPTNPPPPKACCKTCTPGKSKACGDSCISLDKTCHKAPGCAC